MGCTDCHQEAKPNVHPAEGFAEVGCVSCHPDSAEAYKKTTHGMVLESGVERAPRCEDWHTSHYIRKIDDPESPVRASRLPGVCVQCHMEAKTPSGFWAALASFSLQGHPKTDLNERFNTQGCSHCHPGNTGHPQKPEGVASCVKCQDPSVPTPVLMSPVHFKISFREQPVPYLLRFFYGAGLGLIILGGIGFFSYRAHRHRKDEKGSAPPPRGGRGRREVLISFFDLGHWAGYGKSARKKFFPIGVEESLRAVYDGNRSMAQGAISPVDVFNPGGIPPGRKTFRSAKTQPFPVFPAALMLLISIHLFPRASDDRIRLFFKSAAPKTGRRGQEDHWREIILSIIWLAKKIEAKGRIGWKIIFIL